MSIGIIIGIIAGLILGWLSTFLAMPKLMFKESESSLGFEDTVSRIEKQVAEKGWKTPAVHDLQATMKKFSYDVQSVKVFEICHPDHSYNILRESDERIVSSMMPCRISVYEKHDGSVWISRMNSGVVAKPMTKVVRKTMSAAAKDVEVIIAEVLRD
ncbi:MAG: DUF302 domain-containing protein [Bacteroidetes bacterium]|nr:DUF302 domain-containing protein [Bacteroidota bacterium]